MSHQPHQPHPPSQPSPSSQHRAAPSSRGVRHSIRPNGAAWRSRSTGFGVLPVLLVALCLVGLVACSEDDGEPVGSLAAEPARTGLPYGTFQEVDLIWVPSAPLDGVEGAPKVFVHLIDDEGRLLRTFDHDLPQGWNAGETISYPVRLYQSILAPPLGPGTYRLSAGLYDGSGKRWPLTVAGGERLGRSEYAVVDVQVPEERGGFPSVGFGENWSATIAGGDRQVLAVRWLSGQGSIQLSQIDEPGRLWIELFVPRQEAEQGSRRVFVDPAETGATDGGDGGDGADAAAGDASAEPDDRNLTARGGAQAPQVLVTTDCSGFEQTLEGEGTHEMLVPVTAAGGSCEIRFRPNFYMTTGDLDQRSVLLQNIAWNGAEDGTP